MKFQKLFDWKLETDKGKYTLSSICICPFLLIFFFIRLMAMYFIWESKLGNKREWLLFLYAGGK